MKPTTKIRRNQKETIKYLTTIEVVRFLSRVPTLRDKLMFTMMYLYGLRCVEASEMIVSDIRLQSQQIYIAAAKNGISGIYYLHPDIRPMIIEYLKYRKTVKGSDQVPFLFVSDGNKSRGQKLSEKTIQYWFKVYGKKARIGLAVQHAHTLRHSIAVHMASSGSSISEVQMHLRHKTQKSTMVYFGLTDQGREKLQKKAFQGEFIAKIS
jgi:site-specific recombinase XerD